MTTPLPNLCVFDQPQGDSAVRRPEHRRATPYHYGVDVQAVLVDQVVTGELRGEVGAAEDEVSTGFTGSGLLEISERVRSVLSPCG